MSRTIKSFIIFFSSALLFMACSSSNKQTESAVDSSDMSSSFRSASKATGLAKWQVNAPNNFSAVKWASVADNYPAANLEITPDEDFTARIKTLLNGVNYNLDEYVCTNSDANRIANGTEIRIVTCVIPAFQEYSYFISLVDPSSKNTRIYEIKDISINKYLGKPRESDPERVYSYDIDEVESLPFMDTNATLVRIDRGFKLSYSTGGDDEASTVYHTYENYIIAGDDGRLVTHWSSKHSQHMSDWMSCDKSNPDPKLCPSIQIEEVCKSADFDGKSWNINKSECVN